MILVYAYNCDARQDEEEEAYLWKYVTTARSR